ncbi:hypothetical protein [Acidisoma silvae]|uniref:hypothetical protein n=1 Tax=Acidisoma silvae TaxID=2802396 RepID=UPI002222FC10|nr:hypothetical protein [Acidisoma silvae]
MKPAAPAETTVAPMPMPVPPAEPVPSLAAPSQAGLPVDDAPLPAAPPPVTPAAMTPPPDTARLADTLASRPGSAAPAPVIAAESSASTRTLLDDVAADIDDDPRPDAEERRLSHELSFGETDYRAPGGRKPHRGRLIWFILLIVIVLIIAAILFEPQLIAAVPALGSLYAAVGL